MKSFTLYGRYALRSFVRGRSRSLFGAFCVAVGIASVVALGLVGANFQSAATGDAQKQNRGDLSVSPAGFGLTESQYRTFADLKARGAIVDYTANLRDDTSLRTSNPSGASTVGSFYAVEPGKFPFYDTITIDRPAGASLASLLANPHNAVVNRATLNMLHLQVGQPITVNSRRGFVGTYTIAGIVPDNAPDPTFGSGFFNEFAMVNTTSVATFFRGLDVGASNVYIKTRDASQAKLLKRQLEKSLGGFPSIKTSADVARDQKNLSATMNKFFGIMGLVAVIISGIGIINTTLVAARRRTGEIAVLKALGMKGRQVVYVFALESLFLAVAGTVVGVLGGIAAGRVVNNVTEGLAGYPIPWSVQLRPIVAGTLVGLVATVLFAYLPALKASRARPIAALRGESSMSATRGWFGRLLRSVRNHPVRTVFGAVRSAPLGIVRLPRRQGFRNFWLILGLAALMGYLGVLYTGLVGGMQAVVVGAIAGIGVLVAAGIITQVFVVVVWLVSKLPAFRSLALRMAFRSMGTQKRRLASTMLALCVGMLAVGSIAILAQNMKSFIAQGIGRQLGYKVVLQLPHNPAAIGRANAAVSRLPGITLHQQGAIANNAELVAVNGHDVNALLQDKLAAHQIDRGTIIQLQYGLRGLEARDLRMGSYDKMAFKSGRHLTAADIGTDHITLMQDLANTLGITVGSRVTYRDGMRRVGFTVVGLADPSEFYMFSPNQVDLTYINRHGLTGAGTSHRSLIYVDMRAAVVSGNLASLRQTVHGGLVLDLSNFVSIGNQAIDKLALFPEIIAGLSLFAGAVIIANTVALAMLERRREIGIMKAVGARRRTILQFLFVENAIVGLLGAALGVLLAMFATAMVDQQILKIGATFDWLTVGALLLLGVALAVVASSLTALPASSEKPMTVLRYE